MNSNEWDHVGAGALFQDYASAYTYDLGGGQHGHAADYGFDYQTLYDYNALVTTGFSFDGPLYTTTAANESTTSSPSPAGGPVEEGTRRSSVTSTGSATSGSHRAKFSPKPKFSAEDDHLLIELKENRKMTWRQIAEHFDGRTAGALQVRYCTKLKARSGSWTDQDIAGLKKAVDDYEHERWNIVAQKMGNKFSPQACRDKLKQLHHLDDAPPDTHTPM
jgi:hypothetical protein